MCCEKTKGCQKPKELKTTPKECSPEQIRKCHGDDAGHPCAEEEEPQMDANGRK